MTLPIFFFWGGGIVSKMVQDDHLIAPKFLVVGWGLKMVLLWPHSWSKFIDLLFLFLITYHLIVCISCFYIKIYYC